MAYSDHEQALRVVLAISVIATGCCLRYGLFASILRQPVTTVDDPVDGFHHYYDLLRTLGLSTSEDMIHPTRTWLICLIGVPEPVERYFLQGFHRWQIEWIEVIGVEDIVLPTDLVLLSSQDDRGPDRLRLDARYSAGVCLRGLRAISAMRKRGWAHMPPITKR
jgi:hypothetical protein